MLLSPSNVKNYKAFIELKLGHLSRPHVPPSFPLIAQSFRGAVRVALKCRVTHSDSLMVAFHAKIWVAGGVQSRGRRQ